MKKVVIVTGGSSGIGLNTARILTEKGCHVYELSRHENKEGKAVHIQADVTDEAQVKKAVETVLQKEGRSDGYRFQC